MYHCLIFLLQLPEEDEDIDGEEFEVVIVRVYLCSSPSSF